MKDLSEIRVEIDKIDREMIDLFRRRMDCAKEVAAYKQANHIPVLNTARMPVCSIRISWNFRVPCSTSCSAAVRRCAR